MIAHIAALSENRVIGINGTLPWKISADLKHFKNLTTGKCVIMGRKTFASLPGGALPNRANIVITRDPLFKADNCTIAHSVDDALEQGKKIGNGELMIIGGAEIYKQTLSIVNTLYLTIVHQSLPGDAYYPEWKHQFSLVECVEQEEKQYKFSFCTFQRV